MGFPTKQALAFRAREAGLYATGALKRPARGQVRAIIFAQGRTGSTLLENLLASTGHFAAQGEILSCDAHEVKAPLAYVRAAAKRTAPRNVACHVKVYHLTRDRRRPVDPARFLRALHAEGWTIIQLRRRDILRHGLSTLVAEARGDFHRFDDREEDLSIAVDPDELRQLLAERRAFAELAPLPGGTT